jgi:hypothetical protein
MINSSCCRWIVGVLLLWQTDMARCQDAAPFRKVIAMHDTVRPVFLRANVVNGDIRVIGGEPHEMVIEAFPREKSATEAKTTLAIEATASETNATKSVTIREEENRYYINVLPTVSPVDLVIHAPRTANLKLHTRANGGISVEKMASEIEAESFNGNINIDQASDTVVAHTGNGRIDVSFNAIRTDKPMSFTTVNGDVKLVFPPNLKARARMDSVTGLVVSEFEIRKLSKPRGNREAGEGKTASLSSKKVNGQIGGDGGPDLLVKSLTGSIHLQKKK